MASRRSGRRSHAGAARVRPDHGPGRWRPRHNIGTFPVRFPHPDDPEMPAGTSTSAFPTTIAIRTSGHDFSAWRVNIVSRGRAL